MPHLIDLQFQEKPGVIASYAFDTGDGLALVDTGPTSTLPALEDGLRGLGASLGDVRHVLITHIHFDHAGAAGRILDEVRGARVYVHERGAGHLARPERLVASATQIYGDQMDRLWGEMRPIDPDRMTVLSGDEFWKMGREEVRALYTPGHAVHHLAYHLGDDLYGGDVAGIRLSEAQTPRGPTPPPDINLEDWRQSIERLRGVDARQIHLPHFGSYALEARAWDALLGHLDHDAEFVRERLEGGAPYEAIVEEYTARLMEEIATEGADLPSRFEFACPPWMSVQGMIRYWQRRSAKAAEGNGSRGS